MILVAGESLIDMLPHPKDVGTDPDCLSYRGHAGGSPFNVARALGRLGVPVQFLCPLSTDRFGVHLRDCLVESHVDISACPQLDAPSTLGFVDPSSATGSARYVFYTEKTAGCALRPEHLPNLQESPIRVLHFGSFSLGTDPIGSSLKSLCDRRHPSQWISLDPNIRPFLIHDREAYLDRLNGFLSVAHLVKLSDEDLEWIAPGTSPEAFCEERLQRGNHLVVVTRGANGLLLANRSYRVSCPVVPGEVADTVGAGDTCQAALLAWLYRQAPSLPDPPEFLSSLSESQLRQMGHFAAQAAAINCSRPGCNPPWAWEMERGATE